MKTIKASELLALPPEALVAAYSSCEDEPAWVTVRILARRPNTTLRFYPTVTATSARWPGEIRRVIGG